MQRLSAPPPEFLGWPVQNLDCFSGPRLPRALPERPRSPGWTLRAARPRLTPQLSQRGHRKGACRRSGRWRGHRLKSPAPPTPTRLLQARGNEDDASPPESDPSEHRTSGAISEAYRPPSPALSVPLTLPLAGSAKAKFLSSRCRVARNGVFSKASAP